MLGNTTSIILSKLIYNLFDSWFLDINLQIKK